MKMPVNGSLESCKEFSENCTNIVNDQFVFEEGSSGDLTEMYVILKTVFI